MDPKIAEVYSETGNTWGFELINQHRGYLLSLGLSILLLTGTPWWLKPILDYLGIIISRDFIIAAIAVIAVLIAIASLFIYKKKATKEIEFNYALHELAHYIRTTTQMREETAESVKDQSAFELLCNEICNKAARVLQIQRDSDKIACCIRLTNPREKSYKTVGRSMQLSSDRSVESEPVTIKSGVYKKITSDSFGNDKVLYIKDLKLAVGEGIISQDSNIQKFPDEIKSMMIARLNARIIDEDTREWTDALLGILYFTSPKERGFSKLDVDRVKTVSDMIADAIWQVATIRDEKNDSNGQNGEKSEQNNEQNVIIQRRKRKSARRK